MSELALKLIYENKQQHAQDLESTKTLDLGMCELRSFSRR
jgi:hypothetical protein